MQLKPFLTTALLASLSPWLSALQINEIRIDEPGSDVNEFAELKGTPDMSLDNIWYIILGDHSGEGAYKGSGTVEFAINLTGYTIGDDGFFVIGNSTADAFDVSLIDYFNSTDSFENNDNVTHLLVRNYTGPEVTSIADQLGDLAVDIDDNDDGTPNTLLPWDEVIDAVSVVADPNQGEWPYGVAFGGSNVGPLEGRAPGHIFRYSDSGAWAMGVFERRAAIALDTPRGENPAVPQEPFISGFSPFLVRSGDQITITGQRLADVTEVSVAGAAASVSVREATRLVVDVPASATFGPIVVSNSAGSFSSTQSVTLLPDDAILLQSEDFAVAGEISLGIFSQFSLSGTRVWERREFNGKGYAVMNGFQDDAASDDWLISEPIDLSNAIAAAFSFRTAGRFEGPALEVKISSDYAGGAPATATWVDATGFQLATGNNYEVEDSGVIDLAAFLGQTNVRVAFRYTSGTVSDQSRNWQVHNFASWAILDTPGPQNPNPWAAQDRPAQGWAFAGFGVDSITAQPGFWMQDAAWPWVLTTEHGWLYIDAANWPQVLMYNLANDIGWLYTARDTYPWLYAYELDGGAAWLYFYPGSSAVGNDRIFFHSGTGEFIFLPIR